LLRHLAGTLQDVVGVEEASGFISLVGQKMGDEINASYKSHLILLFRLTPRESSVTRFIVLNQRIDELSQKIMRRKSLEGQLREERE